MRRGGCIYGPRHAAAVILFLFGLFAAAPSGLAQPAGVPRGEARIWIYRTYNPYVTQATPYVRINGRIVGVAWLGSAFPIDVPPGVYRVTADSRGRDVNQFVTLDLTPGQTVFVKVTALNWWGGACYFCQVNTFYTRLVTPQFARLDMPAPG